MRFAARFGLDVTMGKNRRSKGRFVGFPYNVVGSEQFAALRSPEVKLLMDLSLQYNGNNNGMLSPCYSLMSKRGWATSSLYRAYAELVHRGFLVVTRQGWKQRGRPTLVAFTWNGIDDPIKIDYDDSIKPSGTPLRYWAIDKKLWKHQPTIKAP